jgi:hypothetical protein
MHDLEQYSMTTLKLIESSARRVIDNSKKDRTTAATTPGRWSIPFGAKTLYQAAIMLSRRANRTGDVDRAESFSLLKDALGQLNRRWKVAGIMNYYFEPFITVSDENVGKYLVAMEDLAFPAK